MRPLHFDGRGFDLGANADAPLAPWAETLLALPYRALGRAPEAVDCMGVVEFVQAALGRPLRCYAELYRDSALEGIDALVRAELTQWIPGAGEVGDVLFVGRRGLAYHVAVLCGAGRALQARNGHGVTIDRIEGRRAVSRFCGAHIYGVARPR